MSKSEFQNPFHSGELEAQRRAGVVDLAQQVGGFIRDYLPEQHRNFYTALPFLVVAGSDSEGKVWTTLIEGNDGFIQSPEATQLTLDTELDATDPLAASIKAGTQIGVVGIDLATRRRNRFSGFVSQGSQGYAIDITQSFGNCPQYINQRAWSREARVETVESFDSTVLDDTHIQLIAQSDTMFLGSGQLRGEEAPSRGFDASHRGGIPGFVKILNSSTLQFPDYAGNNFFNTIGNLLTDPRIGLLFIDFHTGSLLHITGTATIEWQPEKTDNSGALRTIDVEIHSVRYRPGALSLRWAKQEHEIAQLQLVKRKIESADITSFYFSSVNGEALKSFKPGQHLPIELQIAGQTGTSKRTYSLSGPTKLNEFYRLSVKREPKGLVSRYFHDQLHQGSIISAQSPSGDFVLPSDDCPVVLVSAGVGLTPMLSMLHEVAEQKRPAWFVHSARNGQHHALREEVHALAQLHQNIELSIHYSQPDTADALGRDYDVKGRVLASHLLDLQAGDNAHYLLCGPVEFLNNLSNALESAGVPAERVHSESFGPEGVTPHDDAKPAA